MRLPLYAMHSDGAELDKLLELRARTDRQILELVRSTLNTGLALAALAAASYARGDAAAAAESAKRACHALLEARQLAPLAGEQHAGGLEPKLRELQAALDRLSCQGSFVAPQTALRVQCA